MKNFKRSSCSSAAWDVSREMMLSDGYGRGSDMGVLIIMRRTDKVSRIINCACQQGVGSNGKQEIEMKTRLNSCCYCRIFELLLGQLSGGGKVFVNNIYLLNIKEFIFFIPVI